MQIAWNRTDGIVDECLTAIEEQGRTVEDCLALYPEQKEKLERLLRLALRLRALRSLKASPEFKETAQVRLRHLAATTSRPGHNGATRRSFLASLGLHRKPNPTLTRNQPLPALLFRAACLALVLLVVTGLGTFGASAQSLPGDFLYPVKLAQENIQITFAVNEADQARLHLEFAGRRLDEVMALLQRNRTTGFEQALENYNDQIQAELQFLGQESGLSASEQSGLAQSVLTDVASHQARLATLTQEAPATAQGSIVTALAVSQKACNRAEEIILNPNDNDGGQTVSTSTLNLGSSPTPVPANKEATRTPSPANPSISSPPPAQIPSTPTPEETGTLKPTPGDTGTQTSTPEDTGTPMPTHGFRASPPDVRVTPLPRNSQTPMPTHRTWGTLPDPKATDTPRKTRTPWPRSDPWQTPTWQAPYP